jgi:hypothetical protein
MTNTEPTGAAVDPGHMPALYSNNVVTAASGDGMLRMTFMEQIFGGQVVVTVIQMTSDRALDLAAQIQKTIADNRRKTLGNRGERA